jgi:hypothetical protein
MQLDQLVESIRDTAAALEQMPASELSPAQLKLLNGLRSALETYDQSDH